MKVNGIELLQMIKEEKIKSNTEIKVWFNYRIKEYITTLWFDGIDLNWQPTTFYARYFYNKYIEFEIIEKEKEIEYPLLHKIGGNETTGDKMPNQEYLINCNFEHLNKAVYQLIDEVNKLKKNKE